MSIEDKLEELFGPIPKDTHDIYADSVLSQYTFRVHGSFATLFLVVGATCLTLDLVTMVSNDAPRLYGIGIFCGIELILLSVAAGLLACRQNKCWALSMLAGDAFCVGTTIMCALIAFTFPWCIETLNRVRQNSTGTLPTKEVLANHVQFIFHSAEGRVALGIAVCCIIGTVIASIHLIVVTISLCSECKPRGRILTLFS